MTVFNEEAGVSPFFESLLLFTRQPDEVVIVDGGSSDGTVAGIREWGARCPVPVVLVEEQRCNISRGRNLAIERARFPVIAITDMGCRIPPDWLARLIAPFEADPSVEVVGGYYGHHCETRLQQCFADLRYKAVLNKKNFYPSSRSLALRRHVWEEAGGYPEHMIVGEDMYFDLRIREGNFNEVIEPEAKVYWETAGSYRGIFRKYYRYARSAGAVFQQPKVYGFYIVNYALFLVWLLLALGISWWFIVPLAGHGAVYKWFRIFRKKPVRQNLTFVNMLHYGAITFTLDMATILGYLAGLTLWIRRKPEVWTPPPQDV